MSCNDGNSVVCVANDGNSVVWVANSVVCVANDGNSVVCVAQSLVWCKMFFVYINHFPFSFGHFIVYSSLRYDSWEPLCYLHCLFLFDI